MDDKVDETTIVMAEDTQDEIEMLKKKIDKIKLTEILKNFR